MGGEEERVGEAESVRSIKRAFEQGIDKKLKLVIDSIREGVFYGEACSGNLIKKRGLNKHNKIFHSCSSPNQ